jgi:glycosyltransferase involved in cell wall biosynthesis
MWPAEKSSVGSGSKEEAREGPVKIIGSVGNLGATGNTFALDYLGRELLPRLAERLKGREFEIHLLGKGTPSPRVANYLTDPRVKFRGWVHDIKQEFRSAAVFLVLTNVSPDFLVGNTRILLAWTLRTCVVMHENSRRAMPEIEHGVNALLGRTPDEIASWVTTAIEDEALRGRIGRGGGATFDAYYRSDVVVPAMLGLVDDMVQQFRAGTRGRLPAPGIGGNDRLRRAHVERRHVH